MSGIKIKGTGRFVPAKAITNEYLSTIVDTSDEWITSRTGIKTRFHCTTETHTDMCVGAARQALENAGIKPEEIGACVVANTRSSVCPPLPAACLQRELGLPHDTVCFDLNAACSGFLFALHTMECLLAAAPRNTAWCWAPRCSAASSTGRTGAPASSSATVPAPWWWSGGRTTLHPRFAWLPRRSGYAGRHRGGKAEPARIFMHGQPTFKFAVQAVPYCIDQVLERSGKTMDDVDFFVFTRPTPGSSTWRCGNTTFPPEKYYKNIQTYGNTSAASIPLVISELHDLGKGGPGSRILVVGFGGGLTWGGALIEFA